MGDRTLCVAHGVAGAQSPTLSPGDKASPSNSNTTPSAPQSCSFNKASSLSAFQTLVAEFLMTQPPPLLPGFWERAQRPHLTSAHPTQALPDQASYRAAKSFCPASTCPEVCPRPLQACDHCSDSVGLQGCPEVPWAHGGRSWWITALASSPCTGATLWCALAISEPKC